MDSDTIPGRLRTELKKRFGAAPEEIRVVRAPLRICPLGAHIDHQGGTVTAMAIDRAVHLSYIAASDTMVRLTSLSFPGETRFHLDRIPPRSDDWGNYARGAAAALESYELTRGILGITHGDHGEGGLSSSAAVGVAYLLAMEEANGLSLSKEENVRLDRAIENDYLGLRNGILDQAAILYGKKDHLTRIDCRLETVRAIPRPATMPPFAILVAFSGVRQGLTSTDYNTRVGECTEAAAALLIAAGRPAEKPLLADVTTEEYAEHGKALSGGPAKRARHFFTETSRVEQGVSAWQAGDLATFGQHMTDSGRSSIENYECGSTPLINLYDSIRNLEGVYGTRFSGAGFRGCCIALIDPGASQAISQQITSAYSKKHPELSQAASIFICNSDDGARFL